MHVYYDDEESRARAMELRDKMRSRAVDALPHRPFDRPIGPHPAPMWEADFASYENRDGGTKCAPESEAGDLSVLIHPQIDSDYADHTKTAAHCGRGRREPMYIVLRNQPPLLVPIVVAQSLLDI